MFHCRRLCLINQPSAAPSLAPDGARVTGGRWHERASAVRGHLAARIAASGDVLFCSVLRRGRVCSVLSVLSGISDSPLSLPFCALYQSLNDPHPVTRGSFALSLFWRLS